MAILAQMEAFCSSSFSSLASCLFHFPPTLRPDVCLALALIFAPFGCFCITPRRNASNPTFSHCSQQVAKELAAAVIPNEYGIQPLGKLRIGSMICAQLLGKLLADLASMREESMATVGMQHSDEAGRADFVADVTAAIEAQKVSKPPATEPAKPSVPPSDASTAPADMATPVGATDIETDSADVPIGGEDDAGDDGDDAVLHRLCPTYAQDVNSPLRHVRTRIYFTSESHCHSLVNVLRYCHLGMGAGAQGLLSEAGQRVLHESRELDYMTHIVFRMFENKRLPLDDPGRFRVEFLFSPGAAHDPYEVVPLRRDHVISIVPRVPIHGGGEMGNVIDILGMVGLPYLVELEF